MASRPAVLALTFAIGIVMAQVPNLSGTWKLNLQKSIWGNHPKPTGGTVTIEHREPAFKYSGEITVQNGTEGGEEKQRFQFDGAIDDKEYPVTGNIATGKMTIRRLNPATTVSELKSNDGIVLETAKTTVSSDGKTMVRELRASGPKGQTSWTEVYERQ